ncbi:MAG TPA: hypothetical protein VGK88_06120 [bacterium]|jgi:hypothetical protein
MPVLNYVVAGILLVAAAVMVVAQHLAFFRRVRPPSFAAFLETAGWLIMVLVALGGIGGGLGSPGTLSVEIASGLVGLACILAGRMWMRWRSPRA